MAFSFGKKTWLEWIKDQLKYLIYKQNNSKWNFFLDFILYGCPSIMKFLAKRPYLKQKKIHPFLL